MLLRKDGKWGKDAKRGRRRNNSTERKKNCTLSLENVEKKWEYTSSHLYNNNNNISAMIWKQNMKTLNRYVWFNAVYRIYSIMRYQILETHILLLLYAATDRNFFFHFSCYYGLFANIVLSQFSYKE